jgi:hypothetical protein
VVLVRKGATEEDRRIPPNSGKFENRPLGPTTSPISQFSQLAGLVFLSCVRRRHEQLFPIAIFANTKINFARDLQDRLGILALLALSAPFRICKLQIPLADGETDPVSGHHLESTIYKM